MSKSWVALDKKLATTFSKIRRPYSEIEAMFSLSLDVNCGKVRSMRSYSRMWSWSRSKTVLFLKRHNKKETAKRHKRDSKETVYSLILLDIDDTKRHKRDTKETVKRHKYKEQEQEQDKKTMSGKDARPPIPYKKIVEYFNKTIGSNYKPESVATRRLIKARFNEGFTEENFKSVISYKNEEWAGDEVMNQYLRPQTLFGTKFEAYLQKAGNGDARKTMADYYKGGENVQETISA